MKVEELYGNRVRVRVSGICIKDNKILLVNHSLYGSGTSFWNPPGGGVQFGEKAIDALKREFKEETGLKVEAGEMLFMNEFIQPPLHAIEIFFQIFSQEGVVETGADSEFSENDQIIREVKFMDIKEVNELPYECVHSILKQINSFDDILKLKGYVSLN